LKDDFLLVKDKQKERRRNMKKKNIKNVLIAALLSTVLFFIPSLALPADVGNIDGLWWSPVPGAESYFSMFRESQGLLLVTMLDGNDMSWGALYGPISGNSAAVQLLLSGVNTVSNGNITFTSDSSAVAVVTDCQPPEACPFPLDVEIPFIKLF
jgi:hypothetical protein